MLQILQGLERPVRAVDWRTIMRRFNRVFSLSFVVTAIVFTSVGFANVQKRNEKEVRDIVRSLTAKVSEFEYNLNYQMTSSSADRNDIATVADDLRVLKSSV